MSSSETPDDRAGPVRPLQYNLELLAHLIYLARHSKPDQQQRYMEWAENVIKEMKRDPKVCD